MKALYRCIKSGLLWYNLFSETLCKIGFALNPYDVYVVNKVVNGKKFTITWYVNNLKISHIESSVMDEAINDIESYFGKMNVARGLTHKYIGIDIEFTGDDKVTFFQKERLLEYIEAFEEDIITSMASLAQKGLFNVNADDELLDENRSKTFHSVV